MSNRFVMLLSICVLSCLGIFSMAFADEFRYDSHGKRDPFIALNVTGQTGLQLSYGELTLEGVVVDQKGESLAIVNGEIVKQGQIYKGYLLKQVDPKKVIFEKDSEQLEIPLNVDEELMSQSEKGNP